MDARTGLICRVFEGTGRALGPIMNAVAFPTPLALVVGLPSAAADVCSFRLRRAGYRVVRAAHGPAACELAREMHPTLVVASRTLWALERRALDAVASSIGADVLDDAALDRALRS
jgi:CheY-like chemotaxis protein